MELLWPAAPVGLMRTASSLVLLKSQQASLAKLLQLDLSLKPSSQRDFVMSLGLEALLPKVASSVPVTKAISFSIASAT